MESTKFDIVDYLDSNEMIAEYLNAVLEEGSDTEIITAIGAYCQVNWMTKIAEETGMSRTSLQGIIRRAKPQFSEL